MRRGAELFSSLLSRLCQHGYVLVDAVTDVEITQSDRNVFDGLAPAAWEKLRDEFVPGDEVHPGLLHERSSGMRRSMAADAIMATETLPKKLQAAQVHAKAVLDGMGIITGETDCNTHVATWVVLHSKVGCHVQKYIHCDRAREDSQKMTDEDSNIESYLRRCHISAMVALMDDTAVHVKIQGKNTLLRVAVPKGSMLLWRGDWPHCGAANTSDHDHYRLFAHIDSLMTMSEIEVDDEGYEVLLPAAEYSLGDCP